MLPAQKRLREFVDPKKAAFFPKFFRTGPGEYGEGDKFIGITVPQLRLVAKEFKDLDLKSVTKLLESPIHEDRSLALFILTERFRKSDDKTRNQIYKLYLKKRKHVNNWDLVDGSAAQIVGATLENSERKLLYKFARSKSLWERRIAIISTFHFIRKNDLKDTYAIAKILLHDDEDLIHKAVGWMLREAGKRDLKSLEIFLKKYAAEMPRTMLRYSLEKLPPQKKAAYMKRS